MIPRYKNLLDANIPSCQFWAVTLDRFRKPFVAAYVDSSNVVTRVLNRQQEDALIQSFSSLETSSPVTFKWNKTAVNEVTGSSQDAYAQRSLSEPWAFCFGGKSRVFNHAEEQPDKHGLQPL